MPTYAKIPEGTGVPSYLTAGKEYLTKPFIPPEGHPMAGKDWPNLFYFEDDSGQQAVGRWPGCAHLGLHPWERIERKARDV